MGYLKLCPSGLIPVKGKACLRLALSLTLSLGGFVIEIPSFIVGDKDFLAVDV